MMPGPYAGIARNRDLLSLPDVHKGGCQPGVLGGGGRTAGK